MTDEFDQNPEQGDEEIVEEPAADTGEQDLGLTQQLEALAVESDADEQFSGEDTYAAEEPPTAEAGDAHDAESEGDDGGEDDDSADESAEPGQPVEGEEAALELFGPFLNDDAAAALATVPAAVAVADETVVRDIDLGPEGPPRWWVWALVGVGVAVVLGVAVYAWWWSTSRPISVPDIVGKQPAEAVQILNDLDLRTGEVSEVPTDSAPVGTIVSQKPEAGSKLKPDAKVAFVVAAPPDTAKVPEVSGLSSELAQSKLAEARLRPVVVESFDTSAAVGFVVSQVPSSGVELGPGSPVALVVSKGPAPANIPVPKVVGLTESDAIRLIEANDLKAAVYRSVNASVPAGEVASQTPLPRIGVPYGSPVAIWVSQGTGVTPLTVPTVVGLKQKEAQKRLKNRKLVPKVRAIVDPVAPKGQVIGQVPPGGSRAASGTPVGILVSRGNLPTVVVPSLVGTGSVEVTETITDAGLRPFVITVEAPGVPAGTVIAQFPPAGTQYQRAFPMVAVIAEAPKP